MQTPALNVDQLRNRLKLKSQQSELLLRSHHPEPLALLDSAGVRPGSIRKHAAKLLAAGAAAGTLLLTPAAALPIQALPRAPIHQPVSRVLALNSVLPPEVGPLTPNQEQKISQILHATYGIHAYAQLEGNHLNQSYGLIGVEQHLPRFPGDNRPNTTPGRGAWGYFAYSQSELTPELAAKERYYVAVQTLYLPDWEIRLPYLRDWYKYRKVVVVNPKNGKTIVADIADAGPASWTGKHFGGSPEVMEYLQMHDGREVSPVVLFFVDDPEGKIPLGPLEYNLESPLALPA